MKKILALCLVSMLINAAEECKKSACTKPIRPRNPRIVTVEPKRYIQPERPKGLESPKSLARPKELVPGAALCKFLGSLQSELASNDTLQPLDPSKDYVNIRISKEELLTLLSSAQAAAIELGAHPETRDFIRKCGAIAITLEKLTQKLPKFLATSYEDSESAHAFLELFFVTCMPNDPQAQQVKAETLKKWSSNKKIPELPKKQLSHCVIL